jgi:hypothetical protein
MGHDMQEAVRKKMKLPEPEGKGGDSAGKVSTGDPG